MLQTIPASECITYDVSYVLVLVTSSLCPRSWESGTWPRDFSAWLITAVMTEDFYANVTDVYSW